MKKILLFSALFSLALLAACNKDQADNDLTTIYTDNNTDIRNGYDGQGCGNGGHNNSVTQDMVVDFALDHANATVNEKVELLLDNKTVHAVSYEWDFGNGDKSTDAKPAYKYKNHGFYTIKLKGTDTRGNVQTVSKNITVLCIYGGGDHDF